MTSEAWLLAAALLVIAVNLFVNERQKKMVKIGSVLPQGFSGDVSFVGRGGSVAIDFNRKRIAILCKTKTEWQLYEFSQMLGAELVAEGTSYRRTNPSFNFPRLPSISRPKLLRKIINNIVHIRIAVEDEVDNIKFIDLRYFDLFRGMEDRYLSIRRGEDLMSHLQNIMHANRKSRVAGGFPQRQVVPPLA